MNLTTTEPATAVARLGRARRVLVTSHSNPDGDAIGSELALAELVERLGAEAVVVNRDPAPSYLGHLPGVERIQVGRELPAGFPASFDLVATVECPGLDRPGFVGLDQRPIVNIDHHRANSGYGEVNFVDEAAPAVGEMVWSMFHAAALAPSPAAATNTFVALSTDTGDFRYSNAGSRAFRAAAEMVEAGARPAEVAAWVHESRSPASIRLLGEALKTLRLDCEGRLASFAVDRDAYRRADAGLNDSEDLINVPRSISGVLVVAFFKQWEAGVVKVSLRSKGQLDVCGVAAGFGGGGHTNAAGCTLHGELATVRQSVTGRLVELVEGER